MTAGYIKLPGHVPARPRHRTASGVQQAYCILMGLTTVQAIILLSYNYSLCFIEGSSANTGG